LPSTAITRHAPGRGLVASVSLFDKIAVMPPEKFGEVGGCHVTGGPPLSGRL